MAGLGGLELLSSLAPQLLQLLPIWIFGAVVGLLLPRPKWLGRSGSLALSATPLLVHLRAVALIYHAALILRLVKEHLLREGALRGVARATVQWLCGNGWTLPALPTTAAAGAAGDAGGKPLASSAAAESAAPRKDTWYVGAADLAFFKHHAVEGGPCEGASPWQLMMQRDVPGFVRYTSWRRTLPSGKTEYKSVTISPNATAREFSDLYLDDDFRRNWDGMVYHHEVLEHGDFAERQQVVRWKRRFPFAFLSDREYTIARREFREPDGSIYACTKALAGHPREASDSDVVKMDVFWSAWRSRTVPDPWGADSPACETVLLHHEQFKIPENLARFAVKAGMWGFVKKLASTVPVYVEARRKRVGPFEDDAEAYGSGEEPNPPMQPADSALSLDGLPSCSSSASECGSEDSARAGRGHLAGHSSSGCSAGRRPGSQQRRVRNVAAVVVAGGLALALGVRASPSSCSGGGSSSKGRVRRRHLSSHRLAQVPELLDE